MESTVEAFKQEGEVVDSTTLSPNGQKKNWLHNRYPGYPEKAKRWDYTSDHYSGNVLQKLDTYLPMRKVAEHPNAYVERKKIAAYTPHLSLVIDSMAGMLQAVEHDAMRQWHDPDDPSVGLGDPAVEGTAAYRLTYNADGEGTNWRTFWNRVLIRLLTYREVGIAVEGVTEQVVQGVVIKTPPRLRLIEPQAQTNKLMAGTVAVERVIKHVKDERQSVKDDNDSVEHYTLFRLADWTEYRDSKKGPVQTDTGTYAYFSDPDRSSRRLPIVWASLPMDRDPAYMAARQCNRMFNTESEQQMATRMGNIPWPVFVVSSDEEFSAMLQGIASGKNAIPQNSEAGRDHHYMTPPPEPAEVSREQLKQYREDFYRTTFQNFVDAVRSTTATEIRQKSRSGIEALLVTLSDALDTAESDCAFLLEQAEFPDDTSMWGAFKVERSKKFQPLDGHDLAKMHKEMFFGNEPVPIGETGRVEVAMKIAQESGIVVDEDEVEQEIREKADQRTQDNDALRNFGL